jgi:hypothetical protein
MMQPGRNENMFEDLLRVIDQQTPPKTMTIPTYLMLPLEVIANNYMYMYYE